jgi:hypothetical protein
MGVEKSVEWLTREAEVLGENLSQCLFVHHKSHMTGTGLEASDYVTAISTSFTYNHLVVRVPGYRSRVPGSIPGAIRFSEK